MSGTRRTSVSRSNPLTEDKDKSSTVRQGQAVAVPDGDVHHSGRSQLLDQFGPERRGFRGTAAQTGSAAPSIHLEAQEVHLVRAG